MRRGDKSALAAYIAAVYPAGPEPKIIRFVVIMIVPFSRAAIFPIFSQKASH
jgi:hypothetical protein